MAAVTPALMRTDERESRRRRGHVRRANLSLPTQQTVILGSVFVCVLCVFICRVIGASSSSEEDEWPMPAAMPYNESYGTSSMIYESKMASNIVKMRRLLHAKPGLMYDEYDAAALVAKTLRGLGIKAHNIRTEVGITGVVAHIGFGTLRSTSETETTPTILLRADMDALPIHEETDVPFKSRVDGVMHACGHDAHTAMLLGAAMALKAAEGELVKMRAAVRLFFQPAEEGGAGAKAMIDQGAMEGADAAVMVRRRVFFFDGHISSRGGVSCSGLMMMQRTMMRTGW